MPADIVCVASLKGGVGKTTTTFALGCAGAARGLSVVVLDLDASISLTRQLQVPVKDSSGATLATVLEVMTGERGLKDALSAVREGFWLVRGSKQLYSVVVQREKLERVLAGLRKQHDLIVIDTEPGHAYLNSAMEVADAIVIPTVLDTVAMPGACDTIQQALDLNVGKRVCGLLASNVRRPMTKDARDLLDSIRGFDVGLETVVYSTVRWPAAVAGGSLTGTPDLADLADRLLDEVLVRRCDPSRLKSFVPLMLSLVEPPVAPG